MFRTYIMFIFLYFFKNKQNMPKKHAFSQLFIESVYVMTINNIFDYLELIFDGF